MRLSKYLPIIFQEWIDRSQFQLRPCNPDEICSRFIFSKKHIYAEKGNPKPVVFQPHRHRRDLSVYRTSSCSEILIWHLCKKYIEPHSKRKSMGRAEFKMKILMDSELKLNPNGRPHKRHLNVEFWPSQEKMITVELSNKSIVIEKS